MKGLTRWSPIRTIRRWDPIEEFRTMQHDMDRLFDRFFETEILREHAMGWMPSAESYTKDNHLVFKVELPGVNQKDLDVSIADRELIIKGERKSEKDAKEQDYIYREISYGCFERRFTLPEGVKTDDLKAKFSSGVLEITVPAPALAKARKIAIEATREEKKQIEAESKKAA